MPTLHFGRGQIDVAIPEDRLVGVRRRPPAPALADPAAAVRAALENPLGFPPLRRALTPDDHVTVVIDERLPRLGPAAEILRQADDPGRALELLSRAQVPDRAAAEQWAGAARRAQIYLLSGLPEAAAEELFVTPMEHADQLQRLVRGAGSYLVLEDADKALPVIEDAADE